MSPSFNNGVLRKRGWHQVKTDGKSSNDAKPTDFDKSHHFRRLFILEEPNIKSDYQQETVHYPGLTDLAGVAGAARFIQNGVVTNAQSD